MIKPFGHRGATHRPEDEDIGKTEWEDQDIPRRLDQSPKGPGFA
jgi:hypothetical protein